MFNVFLAKKTLIFKICLFFFLVFANAAFSEPEALNDLSKEKDLNIVDLELSGFERTSEKWLRHFLRLRNLPKQIEQSGIENMRLKLLKTGVFYHVEVGFKKKIITPKSNFTHDVTLLITVKEAWTTIPVIRAAYGGGEPLKILGIYDTHSFGRLLTLGGQMEQYGEAPWGYVLWIKSPFAYQARYEMGLELWNTQRNRAIYDRAFEEIYRLDIDSHKLRAYMYAPISFPALSQIMQNNRLQAGIDLNYDRNSIKVIEEDAAENAAISQQYPSEPVFEAQVLPTFIFDGIKRYGQIYDGARSILKIGTLNSERRSGSRLEFESFYYQVLPASSNLAMHLFIGQNEHSDTASKYYLGGLDAIRGTPEGVYRGRRAAYLNAEVRREFSRSENFSYSYLWFSDVGGASDRWQELKKHYSLTSGLGLRIGLPKAPRVTFRLDYGWDFVRSNHGIALGMNHFFQPYKPL